jgi:uncharacterized GH25 family protein
MGEGSRRCLPAWPVRSLLLILGLAVAGILSAFDLTHAAAIIPQARASTVAGQPLTLHIVSAETGQPVPGAKVRIERPGPNAAESQTADEQGQVVIEPSPGFGRDRWLIVQAWGDDGFAQQYHSWGERREPIPAGATIRLHPGEQLGGEVQDAQGRPIAGAEILLNAESPVKRDRHEVLYNLRAISGRDGRWHTRAAPPLAADAVVDLVIRHPDYLFERIGRRHSAPASSLRDGSFVSTLTRGVPIEGRVVDADGRPVSGATVLTSDRLEWLRSEIGPFAVTTGPDGRYRTRQLEPGPWRLYALALGHAPGEAAVTLASALPQVEIRLGRPRSFTLKVLDPDGRSIPGVTVAVEEWRGFRGLGIRLQTGDNGRAVWSDAPMGEGFELLIFATGFERTAPLAIGPDEIERTMTLRPVVTLQGRIRNAATSQPIEGAVQVQIGVPEPGSDQVESWSDSRSGCQLLGHNGLLHAVVPVEVPAWKLRIVAVGFAPFVTRTFRSDDRWVNDYEVALVPPAKSDADPQARRAWIERPDGSPLAGASVFVNPEGFWFDGREVRPRGAQSPHPEIRTDAAGLLAVWPPRDRFCVFVLGDNCYAVLTQSQLGGAGEPPTVRATAFGRVEGRFLVGPSPLGLGKVSLRGIVRNTLTQGALIHLSHEATTDAKGRFAFDRVLDQSDARIARVEERRDLGQPDRIGPGAFSSGEVVAIEAGRTVTVTIGGRGRPVVGRVEAPEGWTQPIDFGSTGAVHLATDLSPVPYPAEMFRAPNFSFDATDALRWAAQWRQSPEGRAHLARFLNAQTRLESDGSFRFDDVPPGPYRLDTILDDGTVPGRSSFARVGTTFSIPPLPQLRSDEPFEVGTIRLRPRVELKPGDLAPRVEVTTADGQRLTIPDDFAGRAVLLDFASLWDERSRTDVPRLAAIHARFRDDDRFRLVRLIQAPDNADTRAFIAATDQPWPHAIIGSQSNPVATAYGIEPNEGTARVLIGPDGRIVATSGWNLLMEAISGALGSK